MPRTCIYYKYIPHLVAIRIILLGPFAVARAIADIVYGTLDKVVNGISDVLPMCYTVERVEFEMLPRREQKKFVKGFPNPVLSQVREDIGEPCRK